ncbi:MAG: HAD-IC family P-type ATPase [Pseudomonadota bacterium]|nr:HAD-IC family P-type ATPase [Pseudomonadota bacterium]
MNDADPGRETEPWHQLAADEVLGRLDTAPGGIGEEEAAARLERHGANRLPRPRRRSVVMRFLGHFHNILIYVLIACALVTATLGHLVDTAVILAVVLANAVIGFVQEGRAERAVDAIRHLLAPKANVLRAGTRRTLEAEDLVPGDVVLLEAGDRVPADLRLFQVNGLHVQEAVLTGESVPTEKRTAAIAGSPPLGDRVCMAYSGTLVASGLARGVVVATGTRTEIGRISGMLGQVEMLTTPLVQQMNRFARWLTVVILVVAGGLLLYGLFARQIPFEELFMAVVGLSVAAIPEGLPAVLTITLAVGVQAMGRRHVIVRRLPAIETLGSVSVICTDKTGTLTRNEMMVASVVTPLHRFSLEGLGYEPRGAVRLNEAVISGREHAILEEIGRTAALCNDASLCERAGVWTVEGDPMEGALMALAGKLEIDAQHQRAVWSRTDTIPFDAKHRFMATLNHNHDNHAVISVKGAPEQIFALCGAQRSPAGSTEPLDLASWHEKAEQVAALGQRVLALAVRTVPAGHTVLEMDDLGGELILLGLVGLIDPPRPEAIDAIAECRQAGIRVKMITGDHRGTALAIARQIGLENSEQALTGAELDRLDDAGLAGLVMTTDVFARTNPEHKLRLVMALQSAGLTVAMTGDGVNDAPALKRADAGIAMGLKGSEAAREAAELVLTDDNFASIVAAVREGRTVYDNIKKVISWTLPTNTGEAMTVVVALLFGMALPITPVQILWVNLITAVTLGISLAFEPTEKRTMRRAPRRRDQPLLGGDLAWHIALVSMLFLGGVFGIYQHAVSQGYSQDLARTLAMNTLVVMEIFHLFFIRNIYGTSLTWQAVRGTRVVWITVLTVVAAQFAVTYFPPFQALLSTEAVALGDGLVVVAVGVALFAVIEVEKQLRLRVVRRRSR